MFPHVPECLVHSINAPYAGNNIRIREYELRKRCIRYEGFHWVEQFGSLTALILPQVLAFFKVVPTMLRIRPPSS